MVCLFESPLAVNSTIATLPGVHSCSFFRVAMWKRNDDQNTLKSKAAFQLHFICSILCFICCVFLLKHSVLHFHCKKNPMKRPKQTCRQRKSAEVQTGRDFFFPQWEPTVESRLTALHTGGYFDCCVSDSSALIPSCNFIKSTTRILKNTAQID